MKKQSILLSTILCCVGIAFVQMTQPSKIQKAFDKPDEAIEFEVQMTKDPALGYVPRERLLKAFNQMKAMQAKKTRSAIPGVVWTERGPNNIGGRTRTIMIDPNDATKKTLWAGSVGGGLWKTTDITQTTPTWVNNNDFLDNLAISSMAYDPTNTQKFFCGTGEGRGNSDGIRGFGVWMSADGGSTWNPITSTFANEDFYYCQKVMVTSVGTVLVATKTGIWRTAAPVTTASTFTKVSSGTDFYSDIEISSPGGTIYASSGRFFTNNGEFYRSTDDGLTWNSSADFLAKAGTVRRVDIACKGDTVYAVCQSGSGNGASDFLYSTNGGVNWTSKNLPNDDDPGVGSEFTRSQAWYDFSLEVDPNNANKVWIGGIDVFSTADNGTTWSQITHWYAGFGYQFVHADQHVAMFEPGNSNVLYLANDGGIFRSSNASVAVPTFVEKNTGSAGNKGYNVTQFYACATPNISGSNYFLAGAQDNGSQQFTSPGMNSTVDVNGGDGCYCFVDQTNSNNQLVTYVRNYVSGSTDGGVSFSDLGGDGTGLFVNPMDLADGDNRLYSSKDADEIYRWDDVFSGATITTLFVNLNGSKASHVKVSPNNPHTVYIGTIDGGIYKITNAHIGSSPTITSMNSPWATGNVSCIDVWKSANGLDDSLVATMSNYGVSNSVIFTSNGTAATPTWTNLDNATLPDMPIRWAVFNPLNKLQVLLATELGIWSTNSLNGTSTAWAPTNTGLANVKVNMIRVRRTDNRFVAATHGRGLFTSNILAPLPVLWGEVSALAINNEKVDIHWATQIEQNTDYFTIERSLDGVHFNELAKQKAASYSEVESNYVYQDEKPNGGINYYRIKQVDQDGKVLYSKIVTANILSSQLTLQVYPNPASDQVSLHINGLVAKPIHYTVYNYAGKAVISGQADNNLSSMRLTLNTSFLSTGMYYLELTNGTNKITQSLSIQ